MYKILNLIYLNKNDILKVFAFIFIYLSKTLNLIITYLTFTEKNI